MPLLWLLNLLTSYHVLSIFIKKRSYKLVFEMISKHSYKNQGNTFQAKWILSKEKSNIVSLDKICHYKLFLLYSRNTSRYWPQLTWSNNVETRNQKWDKNCSCWGRFYLPLGCCQLTMGVSQKCGISFKINRFRGFSKKNQFWILEISNNLTIWSWVCVKKYIVPISKRIFPIFLCKMNSTT